jgi:hypothetical protein
MGLFICLNDALHLTLFTACVKLFTRCKIWKLFQKPQKQQQNRATGTGGKPITSFIPGV